MDYIKIDYENHENWLKARKNGIGGSDAACIVGYNPYKSNVDLWLEKTNRKDAQDISNKECVQFGKKAEEPIRELFELEHPNYIIIHNEFAIYSNKEFPYLLASLDGELIDTDCTHGILEIKTANICNSVMFQKWNNRVPDNYYIQILHYFLVTGFKFAILKARICMSDSNIMIKHYYFNANDFEIKRDIEWLKTAEIKFWNDNVFNDKKPDLILPHI